MNGRGAQAQRIEPSEEGVKVPPRLEKSPLRVEGRSSRETAMHVFERSLKENKYRIHTKEFEEDLLTAPVVEVKGFTRPGRLEKLRVLKEKFENRKQELKKLEDLRKRGAPEDKIEEQEEKLDKLTRELFDLHSEARPSIEDPILDNDEIRLMVKRVVPAHLHEFFEKHCQIEYDPDLKEDQLQVSETGKLVFKFGPGLVKLERQDGKLVPRVDKVMFQLGRMVGGLLKEPTGWKEYVRKTRVLQNRAASWEEFVALYLTDPTTAQRIAPEGYAAVKKVFDNLKTAVGADEVRKQLNTTPRTQKFDTKFEFADDSYIGLWGRSLTFMQKISGFGEEFRDRVWVAFRELVPYKQSDWYERTLVEFEDKEVSRILARDEHVTERHKRLKTYFENHDEFGARTLIKSMARTNDSRWWVYHMFLMQFDPLYRKTNGEEITPENYSFIVQNLRISHVGRRHGTKPGEYTPITPKVLGGRRRIKRISREAWELATREEIDKKSVRDLLAVAQEAYEWMECERPDGERSQFEIDEVFGDPDYVPFGLKTWEGQRDQWEEETNNFLRLVDQNFVKQVNQSANYRRSPEDRSQGWFKLDPDQVMMIARLVAVRELVEKKEYKGMKLNVGGARDVRDPFDSEHFKLAQKRAVAHYEQRAQQYRDHLAKGGDPIPAYERFLEYIEYFKEKEVQSVLMRREAELYDEETNQASAIVESEPIISAQDDPNRTAEKVAKVEAGQEKLAKTLQGRIDQLPINARLKAELKEDPRRIREILDDPDDPESEYGLHKLTDKLYQIKKPDNGDPDYDTKYAAYSTLHNKHYESVLKDFAKLREFYQEMQKNQLFDIYTDLDDWLKEVRLIKTKLPEPVKDNETAEKMRREQLKTAQTQVAEELKQFTPVQVEDKPMPRFNYRYQDKTGQTKRELTEQEYVRIKDKFEYLRPVPEDELEDTDLWRQVATKRERRVLQVRISPTETMPFIVGYPPEYEITDQDRPKWLYYQLRLFHAALTNELKPKEAKKADKKDKTPAEPTAPKEEPRQEEDED